VTRDMQILIGENSNLIPPDMDIPSDSLVTDGVNLDYTIPVTDANGDNVWVESEGEAYFLNVSPATISLDSGLVSTPYQWNFTWDVVDDHSRRGPYLFHFKIMDKQANPVNSLLVYRTLIVSFYEIDQESFICAPQEACNEIDPIVTGIERDQNTFNFKVYPNPAQNKLIIHFGEGNSYPKIIRLTDLSGKEFLLKEISLFEKEVEISTTRFYPGIYLLQVIESGNSLTRKIIIE